MNLCKVAVFCWPLFLPSLKQLHALGTQSVQSDFSFIGIQRFSIIWHQSPHLQVFSGRVKSVLRHSSTSSRPHLGGTTVLGKDDRRPTIRPLRFHSSHKGRWFRWGTKQQHNAKKVRQTNEGMRKERKKTNKQ